MFADLIDLRVALEQTLSHATLWADPQPVTYLQEALRCVHMLTADQAARLPGDLAVAAPRPWTCCVRMPRAWRCSAARGW